MWSDQRLLHIPIIGVVDYERKVRSGTAIRDEGDDRMTAHQNTATSERAHGSQPLLYQHGPLIQEYGTLGLLPIAFSHEARLQSCQLLNQILADSLILYSLYKKHHWQMRGLTFEQ
jgi:hypothetical protein